MSDDLIAFLKAWHDWALDGAPDGEPFKRCFGLCTNADIFGNPAFHALKERLYDEFGDEEADIPFGAIEYTVRSNARTQHECPKRLAWVRAQLVEAGELPK